MPKPFRWDLTRREQLGRLVVPQPPPPDPALLSNIRLCSARVLARAGDSSLTFIGRSPESLFDYLSGVLGPTEWRDRLSLVNLSVGDIDQPGGRPNHRELGLVREQLREAGLAPTDLVRHPRPVALVDLVSTGRTLGNLVGLLGAWAESLGTAPDAVYSRLRMVGITVQGRNSPNAWRWQQRVEWARLFRPTALKGVSVPFDFWGYLAGYQDKTGPSNPPWRWGSPEQLVPSRDPSHLQGLREAVAIYEAANSAAERREFARTLARQGTLQSGWCRRLVLQLRRAGGRG